MKQLRTIYRTSLQNLASAINAQGVAREDIQLITTEGRHYVALYWVEAHNGTFHAENYDDDGNTFSEDTEFSEFYQGNLPTGTPAQVLKKALDDWQKANDYNADYDEDTDNGWNVYEGGVLVGRYWVTIYD